MHDIFEKHDFFADKASVPSRLAWGDPNRCPEPHVSVIMPVYKRPEFFALALHSVLEQDYEQPYEVVVVDNNEESTSPNQDVVERMADPRVLYYRNAENLGMYQNWNRGIELARSPYVTFCHDDDILLPHALQQLMELQLVFGNKCILSAYNWIDEAGERIGTTSYRKKVGLWKPRPYYSYSLFLQFMGNISCGDGCLYNKHCLMDLGGYDELLYPVADYALHVAYAHHYGGIVNNVPTSGYRVAVNESLQIYQKSPTLFADKTKIFIHNRLKSQVRFPQKWVDWFIDILYRNSIRNSEVFWKKEGEPKTRLRIIERSAMRLALNISRLVRYQWCWPSLRNSAKTAD